MTTANNEIIRTKIGDTEYTIGTLNVFQALTVTRLVSPIFPILFNDLAAKIMQTLHSEPGRSFNEIMTEVSVLVSMSQPLFEVIAQMPEDHFQKVVKICLSCVERESGKGWAKIMQNDTLMFQDIDQADVLMLVVRVVIKHFRPFMKLFGLSG